MTAFCGTSIPGKLLSHIPVVPRKEKMQIVKKEKKSNQGDCQHSDRKIKALENAALDIFNCHVAECVHVLYCVCTFLWKCFGM